MLHELFGIRGNRVRLSASANESQVNVALKGFFECLLVEYLSQMTLHRSSTQELVISSTSDEFYAKNMYSNYGTETKHFFEARVFPNLRFLPLQETWVLP